jgi:hypothetical protein
VALWDRFCFGHKFLAKWCVKAWTSGRTNGRGDSDKE